MVEEHQALWSEQIEHEAKEQILAYWIKYTVDETNGGFYGELLEDNTVVEEADRSLVLNARILWTFSSAYRIWKEPVYKQTADRAYAYLTGTFTDRQHGGFYWMVNAKGEPVQKKKQTYGQAFAVYAFSEYYRATGDEQALEQAIGLFELMERYAYDAVSQGYFEAFGEAWLPLQDFSLSHHGVQAQKTMNTQLHVMEAYTNLYRVWPDKRLAEKLGGLIALTANRIVTADRTRFALFFDNEWKALSSHISFGHDIEGSWLLTEAAEVLGDGKLLEEIKPLAIAMADAVLAHGTDRDGGLWNESDGSRLIDRNKDWWPQAEAVVGFYNAYQLSGEKRFLEASRRAWQFIRRFLSDERYGEWYWSVTEDGRLLNGSKVNPWKCPYHNGRACFEMTERLSLRKDGLTGVAP